MPVGEADAVIRIVERVLREGRGLGEFARDKLPDHAVHRDVDGLLGGREEVGEVGVRCCVAVENGVELVGVDSDREDLVCYGVTRGK